MMINKNLYLKIFAALAAIEYKADTLADARTVDFSNVEGVSLHDLDKLYQMAPWIDNLN